MTLEDIDHLLDLMAKEAHDKADEAFLPGSISLSVDSWARIPKDAGMRCTNILLGIRYRGVQVLVARAREGRVLNRAEDQDAGAPYFPLEPKA